MKIYNNNFYFNSFKELYYNYPRLKDNIKSLYFDNTLPLKCNFLNENCIGFIYKDYLNNDEYKKLDILKDIDLKCFKKPNNLIFVDDKLYGYTTNYYQSSTLYDLSYYYSIRSVIKNLDNIDMDIENLSNNHMLLLYINPNHLVYNSYDKNIEILYIKEYEVREDLSVEEITLMNNILIHTVLMYAILGRHLEDNLSQKDVLFFIRKKILNKEISSNLSTKEIFECIRSAFEDVINDEVNTLGEFRSLAKTIKIKK